MTSGAPSTIDAATRPVIEWYAGSPSSSRTVGAMSKIDSSPRSGAAAILGPAAAKIPTLS